MTLDELSRQSLALNTRIHGLHVPIQDAGKRLEDVGRSLIILFPSAGPHLLAGLPDIQKLDDNLQEIARLQEEKAAIDLQIRRLRGT
jgi:hypothetical protein